MSSNPGDTPRTPAVDTRSGTPGEIVSTSHGFYYFRPDHGGPEMQVAAHWITTNPRKVRDARAAEAARQRG
ncbi:hypothetical protein OG436_29690 [Streptomyces caniferus]|uniref:hypothetical protein n=1 Tax=Streptomyces caniferus TaxID=285557 RepID=UPI002E2CA044|nr:hypothetical protein [Streptomyces caniferus]